MEHLLGVLLVLVIFAAIAYGAWMVCTKFQLPPPAFWITGVILLIFLLLFAAKEAGLTGTYLPR